MLKILYMILTSSKPDGQKRNVRFEAYTSGFLSLNLPEILK